MASEIGAQAGEEQEEEDYMSMVIADTKETPIQRRARQQREAEARSRPKSKKELEEDALLAREAALAASSLDASNKGYKMMAKLGYKPGTTLGKVADARMEPIHLSMREDRGGIGLDSEKKRKMREQLEESTKQTKKVKVDQLDYRERLRQEREEKRLEGQIKGAQKVAEGLDIEAGEEKEGSTSLEKRPLKNINVLYRDLFKSRREREAVQRMKSEVQNSLTFRTDYNESDEEEDNTEATSNQPAPLEFFEQDLEDDDGELDDFNELDPADRLEKIVVYLRDTYNYCFWCAIRYPDAQLEGCPGLTEEGHD